MMVWFVITIIIMGFYMFLIYKFQKGWLQLDLFKNTHKEFVSVVIAARNEEYNIPHLLSDLSQQKDVKFEVIVVDDFSTDKTEEVVKDFNFVKFVKSKEEGKKAALSYGIAHSNSDIIVTTDADCRLKNNWLVKMIAPFADKDMQLVFGPVIFLKENNFFEKLQSLEFMSLIGSGAGAAGVNQAFICNAANLAFRKSNFIDSLNKKASGDDIFLLHNVKKNRGLIAFVKDRSAIVTTKAKRDLASFLQQRKRWAAKSSTYIDKDAQYISWLVFLVNLSLIFTFFTGSFFHIGLLLFFKYLVDYPFLKRLSVFFNKESLMIYYIPLQFIYPFYIIYVAVMSQLVDFKWKGRKYSK